MATIADRPLSDVQPDGFFTRRLADADVGVEKFGVTRGELCSEERAPRMRHQVTALRAETREQQLH